MNLQRILTVLAGLLIVRVTFAIVQGYRDYFPANFQSDFLFERESYFFGPYQWAFYAHILAGPTTLLLGLLLISEQFRQRFPGPHRSIGKAQIAIVLLLLTPSGLYMAYYAESGRVAGVAFALLAIATAACATLGWRAAVQQRFSEHKHWMLRCFVLLCSAVMLRMLGGFFVVMNIGGNWGYPLAAWLSWAMPIVLLEFLLALRRRFAVSHEINQLPPHVFRQIAH
jgi:hypothetical protein